MPINNSIIKNTEEFVKQAFQKNPHYSFNDWSVMFNHSLTVKNIALEIAKNILCNEEILSICALLHDIGKTYQADENILHNDHEKFNLIVSENFLKSLQLNDEEYKKITDIISYNNDSTEMKIIKDADTLAMYFDKKLYMLFIKWAVERKLNDSIQHKIEKFDHLYFDISRELGKEKLEQMKKDWAIYQKNNI